jgi:hypothetical protein
MGPLALGNLCGLTNVLGLSLLHEEEEEEEEEEE